MAFHGKMVEGEGGGVIFIVKINFIAVLTNPLPPWNHTQIKKNDRECYFFCAFSVLARVFNSTGLDLSYALHQSSAQQTTARKTDI